NILPPSTGARSPILQWAVPFTTAYGRRVEVQALDTPVLFTFLDSLLNRTRSAEDEAEFILDSTNRIAGVSGEALAPGTQPHPASLPAALVGRTHGTYQYGGAERYFASEPVRGSTWRVVLTTKTSELYPAL